MRCKRCGNTKFFERKPNGVWVCGWCGAVIKESKQESNNDAKFIEINEFERRLENGRKNS